MKVNFRQNQGKTGSKEFKTNLGKEYSEHTKRKMKWKKT